MTSFDEFSWLSQLNEKARPEIELGIGDDAALIKSYGSLAISTDSLMEGVHFNRGEDPYSVGWKTAGVNLSDMAAMGCRPVAFFLNLFLCPHYVGEKLELFMKGLREHLDIFEVGLAGGDTVFSKDGPFSISGTIVGKPFKTKAILRSGAKNGDHLYITGHGLGGSYPTRHLNFEPRLEWSKKLCEAEVPSSMIDISDGLLQDLGHILDRSEVGAEVDLWKVPISKDVQGDEKKSLNHALRDGEDFELLFSVSPENIKNIPKDIPLHQVGRVTPEKGKLLGREQENSPLQVLQRKGFIHGQKRL